MKNRERFLPKAWQWSFAFLLSSVIAHAQTEIVNIGNFYTEKHQLIPNCKIGYTSLGTKNPNSSNVIVVPTWLSASSNDVLVGMASMMLDTNKYYIMVVDALGNGISSSPSNTPGFPDITISDMVKATHQLLDDVLHIHQVYAVVGLSMGGLQAFQWGIDFPLFVGKLVSIVGTPKLSTYDRMYWKTQAAILSLADTKLSREESMKLYHQISQLTERTPDYWNQRFSTAMVDSLQSGNLEPVGKRMQPKDYLAQINAIITHDVERYTKSFGVRDMLVVIAAGDQMFTPEPALGFARKHQLTTYILQGIDGQMLPLTQIKKMSEVLKQFLH